MLTPSQAICPPVAFAGCVLATGSPFQVILGNRLEVQADLGFALVVSLAYFHVV